MPNAIPAVIRKRETNEIFGRDLSGDGPSREGGGDALGFEMPSEERSDKVGSHKEIERAAKDRAGDAVEGGAVPSYLGAVDREVWGDRAVFALLDEDRVGGSGGELFGCEGPGVIVRWVGRPVVRM